MHAGLLHSDRTGSLCFELLSLDDCSATGDVDVVGIVRLYKRNPH